MSAVDRRGGVSVSDDLGDRRPDADAQEPNLVVGQVLERLARGRGAAVGAASSNRPTSHCASASAARKAGMPGLSRSCCSRICSSSPSVALVEPDHQQLARRRSWARRAGRTPRRSRTHALACALGLGEVRAEQLVPGAMEVRLPLQEGERHAVARSPAIESSSSSASLRSASATVAFSRYIDAQNRATGSSSRRAIRRLSSVFASRSPSASGTQIVFGRRVST